MEGTGFLDYFLTLLKSQALQLRVIVMMLGLVWICPNYVMPEMRFQNPYCGFCK